jgi:amidophosphoribosyltransferase
VGADTLGYLSPEGLFEAFGRPEHATCAACFTGRYPVEIPGSVSDREELAAGLEVVS